MDKAVGRSRVFKRKDKPVARIVSKRAARWDRSNVLYEAEAFRKRLRIKGEFDLRELIAEGRR